MALSYQQSFRSRVASSWTNCLSPHLILFLPEKFLFRASQPPTKSSCLPLDTLLFSLNQSSIWTVHKMGNYACLSSEQCNLSSIYYDGRDGRPVLQGPYHLGHIWKKVTFMSAANLANLTESGSWSCMISFSPDKCYRMHLCSLIYCYGSFVTIGFSFCHKT